MTDAPAKPTPQSRNRPRKAARMAGMTALTRRADSAASKLWLRSNRSIVIPCLRELTDIRKCPSRRRQARSREALDPPSGDANGSYCDLLRRSARQASATVDEVQERAEHTAALAALGTEIAASGIAAVEQGITRTFPMQHRIVKLVAAEGRAAVAKAAIDAELGRAVAQM